MHQIDLILTIIENLQKNPRSDILGFSNLLLKIYHNVFVDVYNQTDTLK